MSSSRRRAPFLDDDTVPGSQYRDATLALEYRKNMVTAMTRHARSQGLDASEELVNQYYDWFKRWYEGIFATGYLMNRTGVKRITLDESF